MEKLVSIILPTYNGAHRISTSIRSVVDQSYKNWELIIVDDGSTDNTKEIIKKFSEKDSRIKYIKNELNSGIQKTLNKGLSESKGEYIARIDDDDEWIDSEKLKKQVEFLEKNKDYVLVGTGVVTVDSKGEELLRYLLPRYNKEVRSKILSKNCFVHSSVLFRKSVAMKFGGYDETHKSRNLEDYDLWLKLGTKGKMGNLPLYAVKFTIREGSISSNNKLEQLKKSLYIIKRFKNFYPNYIFAIIRSMIRYIVYGFILKLPIKISFNKLLKFYKKFW